MLTVGHILKPTQEITLYGCGLRGKLLWRGGTNSTGQLVVIQGPPPARDLIRDNKGKWGGRVRVQPSHQWLYDSRDLRSAEGSQASLGRGNQEDNNRGELPVCEAPITEGGNTRHPNYGHWNQVWGFFLRDWKSQLSYIHIKSSTSVGNLLRSHLHCKGTT